MKRFSYSAVSRFYSCGEQFRRIYIEGERVPPGIAALSGRSVHTSAEINYKYKVHSGMDKPLDECLDAARDAYVKEVKNGVFIAYEDRSRAKTIVSEGLDSTIEKTRAAHELVFPTVKEPWLIEKWITIEEPELPIPLVGVIDLVERPGVIRDLKTSARKWSAGKIAEAVPQVAVYRHLLKHEFQIDASCAFDVVGENKSGPWSQAFDVNATDEDYRQFILRARKVVDAINAGFFPPAPTGHWLCSPKWCGFWWTCPYIPEHRRRLPNVS